MLNKSQQVSSCQCCEFLVVKAVQNEAVPDQALVSIHCAVLRQDPLLSVPLHPEKTFLLFSV